MAAWLQEKQDTKTDFREDKHYLDCIRDLIDHEMVSSMDNYIQHSDVSTLEHSLDVSFFSYRACKRLGLDYTSAARGALLHDFFLYDWHGSKPYKGLHGFHHPWVALHNAKKYFSLNKLEKEIIRRHMWPLTFTPPRYKEAYIVLFADKYCTVKEILKLGKRRKEVYANNESISMAGNL